MNFASLLPLALLAACTSSSSVDYGDPTPATRISIADDGGYGGFHKSVAFSGTTATFETRGLGNSNPRTTTVTLDPAVVARIIDALEDVRFLSLDEENQCNNAPTDHSYVIFDATLERGANRAGYYAGCSGGLFDELEALGTLIYEETGFSVWAAQECGAADCG